MYDYNYETAQRRYGVNWMTMSDDESKTVATFSTEEAMMAWLRGAASSARDDGLTVSYTIETSFSIADDSGVQAIVTGYPYYEEQEY